MNPNPKAYRLPTHVLPRRYDIKIDARLGRQAVYGSVTIQLEIRESRDVIELHARDMKLTDAALTIGDRTLDGDITQDEEREMAAIKFAEPLPTGDATLHITYQGQVSSGLEALYLAKDGPEECLCTQCEETDARAVFPCFDEPTFKAQFAWQVTTSPEHTVLTNGPLLSVVENKASPGDTEQIVNPKSEIENPSRTWTFAPTKTMSSYLVALVIGDVAATEEQVVNGIPLKVWSLKGKEEMGEFANGFTARLLPWYEEYFDAPYHFDKLDQAAVPGFSAGAMENSGLVIYRQSALIMNPETASWYAEKRIAHVVAHEFAHMWFGNLVTMKWWDDLWLNEAFAEWVSHKAVNALQPDYEIWNDFQGGKNEALADDALESTHPIYSPVETPAEATELFDNITYDKGCAVMHMLENFLGEEAFRAGLRTYMKEFTESNAAGADLWRHLQNAAGQPVTDIMTSWITQGGYPIVKITLDGNTLSLSQRRFFSTPNVGANNEQLWHIPLIIRYEDGAGVHTQRALMSKREATVTLDVVGDLKWVYANADEIGFYRQDPHRDMVKDVLANLDKLTPLEQMGLVGDQWALVRNGSQSIAQFLDVLSALSSTDNYSVLEKVVGRLHSIDTLLEEAGDEAAIEKFRAWVDDAFKEKLNTLGFEPKAGESQNDAQRRVSLVNAMTTLARNPEAIKQAEQWAEREAADPASVDANLAGIFVGAAAYFGDRERFDKYVDVYVNRRENGASPQETNRYLYSLANFRKGELVDRTLELLDEKVLPLESIGPILRQMFNEHHAQLHAWEYVKSHWQVIRNLGDMWTNFLVDSMGNLPAAKRDDFVAFMSENLTGGVAEKSYARALETLDQLAEFKARTKDALVGWFVEARN
jgi:puromycin-sensitive aminopeptidase